MNGLLLSILETAVKGVVVILVLMGCFAYMTWLERKLLAKFQLRPGPNRAGPFGLLFPLADGIKLFLKEDFTPAAADKVVYFIAPIISIVTALFAFAVIPVGPELEILGYTLKPMIADPNVGVLFVLAIASLGVYGLVLAGWSSNNKYSLLGSLRSSAQLISYELAIGLSLLSVILIAGNLQITQIIEWQRDHLWLVLLQPVGFIIYFIAALAETNRAPFDMPEAEQELTAGYQTEYGGMRFALFYAAEFINMVTVSAIASTLFLGGWLGPFVDQLPILGFLYFGLKVFVLIFVFIWIRATLPRVRYDQLMNLGWKYLIPISLVWLMVTALGVVWFGGTGPK
jgi:NADH-quinone oxidoreductase subunit H